MSFNNIIFDRKINFKTKPDYKFWERRISNIKSYAVAIQNSDLVVDHFKCCSHLFHYNPDCKQLLGRLRDVTVEDAFPQNVVCPEDAVLFSKIVETINDAVRNDYLHGDKCFYFTFDILLSVQKGTEDLFTFKAIPFLFTPDNLPWVTVYIIEPSASTHSGNLVLHALQQNTRYNFIVDNASSVSRKKVTGLSEIEIRILCLSAEGFTEQQIADILHTNLSHIKAFKGDIFDKLSTKSISAAILIAYKNGFIC